MKIEMKSGSCGCGDDKKKNMKEEKKQVSEQEQTSFRELVNLCRDIEDLYGHELDD